MEKIDIKKIKSKALSQDDRSYITSRAKALALGDSKDRLAKQKQKVFKALYNKLVPVKHQKTMASLPEGYVEKSTRRGIVIKTNGADASRYEYPFSSSEEMLWPDNLTYSISKRTIGIDDPLIGGIKEQVLDYMKEYDRIDKLEVDTLSATREILSNVKRTRQLLEVWPESLELLPPYIKDNTTASFCPAKVDTSRVNSLLGLNKK